MSNKQLRGLFRIAHMLEGALIIAFIYSSTLQSSELYTALIQYVTIPAIVISGTLLWQQGRVNKWRKRLFGNDANGSQVTP